MQRVSPIKNALFYFVIGSVFIYFAFRAIENTVFTPLSIILIILATLSFGVGIRFLQFHFIIKKKRKKK